MLKIRFAVEYICGYSGGTNQYRREYCKNEEEARKRAEELRRQNYTCVEVIRTW